MMIIMWHSSNICNMCSTLTASLLCFPKMESSTGENSKDALKSNLGNDTCEKMEDVILSEHTQTGAKSSLTEPPAQENRHMEIWSVLENVWNRINVFRYHLLK